MEWIPELTKLLRTKSMILYLPPKGTAGVARSRVRGKSLVPLPPASTMPRTRGYKVCCPAKLDSRLGVIFSGIQPSQINSVQDITSYTHLRRTPNSGGGPSRAVFRLNKPALQNVGAPTSFG